MQQQQRKKTATTLKAGLLGAALMLSGPLPALAAADDLEAAEKDRKRSETTGILGGLVLGAALGGPPGAVVSAMAGGLIGNSAGAEREKRALQASLRESHRQLTALREENTRLERQNRLARDTSPDERGGALRPASLTLTDEGAPQVACCADTELVLHFRTSSAVVEPHYRPALQTFAATVQAIPGAVVEITGHTDRRGDSRDNRNLSERRIQAVEHSLRTLGLERQAFHTLAHGEARPVSQGEDAESHFFDRRVDIKVRLPDGDYLTQAPQ